MNINGEKIKFDAFMDAFNGQDTRKLREKHKIKSGKILMKHLDKWHQELSKKLKESNIDPSKESEIKSETYEFLKNNW